MATLLADAPVAPEIRPWMSGMIRLGYAAKGIIYLLIGTLAFRLAVGFDGGQVTDGSGALRTFLRQPFGLILLTAIGIGILAYSGWQIVEGFVEAAHAFADAQRRHVAYVNSRILPLARTRLTRKDLGRLSRRMVARRQGSVD